MEKAIKKIELTPEQRAVVTNRGGNLLVAAAAGSGKTKVLVDRIMSRICDEGHNINEFVVITYTRAAATELRAKITSELSKRLVTETGKKAKHIQKQLRLVYTAQISTVHSFCGNILREYAAVAGLPTDFRVLEEQESKIFRAAAMEDLLEALYKTIDKRPNVKAFIEELAYGRDDSAVPAILHGVYDTIQSHPWPNIWVAESLEKIDVSKYSDAAETPWGAFILNSVKRGIYAQLPYAKMAQDICDRDADLSESYGVTIAEDIRHMNAILAAGRWDDASRHLSMGWTRLKTVPKKAEVSDALKEQIKALRNRYKKVVDSKGKSICCLSAEALSDLAKTEASVRGMTELVSDFTERYRAKKELHNVMDFSDLEHETIKLLLEEGSNTRTDIAKVLSKRYVEVMVDEYQDTNEVQEVIFDAISTGTNRFMVGDVKQSIYSFRLAEPEIFLRHYSAYSDYTAAEEGRGRKILLSRNFRSRPEILEATNDVMRLCMSEEVGGIAYTDKEALVAGREDFAPLPEPVVELCAINMDNAIAAEEDEEAVAKADVEARYVAGRIKEMLDTSCIQDEETGEMRRVRPSDIAILMRSTKNPAKHYIKALNELGIASSSARNGSILDTTEVATLYAFLQIIDNPMQDIPLVAVLASPLFGFTADMLASIRSKHKDAGSFYEAMRCHSEYDPRTADFFRHLDTLRDMVPYTKLSRLFSEILERTDADDVFGSMVNGDLRMANVHKFNEMISSYEAGGAHGLFEFLCHMESLREQGVELPQASAVTADEAVHIMSIHASKGLEFPVVFLSDLSRRFNTSDLKASALLHKELGVGVQVTDKERMWRYPTIARSAISMATAAEAKSEELRILYVAMTRAKQKLVMTYCDKLSRAMSRLTTETASALTPTVSQSVSNPGEWILQTAVTRDEAEPLFHIAGFAPFTTKTYERPWAIKCIDATDVCGETATMEELETSADVLASEEPVFESPYPAPDIDELEKALTYSYPHHTATKTPSKAVATALYNANTKVTIRRPDFAKAKSGFTAAERGTATHLFMRYADYGKCVRDGIAGIKEEISRMRVKGFISEHDADAVMVPALNAIFSSDVGKELAGLPTAATKREYPFTLSLPAAVVYGADYCSDDNVVVQGIVDLHAVTDDGIILYDFKTDYVEDVKAEEEKAAFYKGQIDLYSQALEIIYDMPVIKREVVFLRVGHKVSV